MEDERQQVGNDRSLFESLASATDAMIGLTDLDANVLWVSPGLVEMTGYSLEDYQFQRFENPYIPAEDVATVGKFLGEFLSSDEQLSGIVRNRFVDRWGGTLYVRSRIAKVDWEGQAALLYSIVAEDPEGKQSIDVEQRYRSLVEAATDSIVRLRPDLTIQFSNRCFQRLVARSPVELNSLSFAELIPKEQRAAAVAVLTSERVRFQLTIPINHGGNPAWLEGTFVRIKSGPDAGLLQAVMRDTTERRLLDARVQTAQKRETLGQMAGGIAHDLNNILTGILGSATLAERDVQPGGRIAEALSDIRIAAQRAGELSSSMLAYAGEGNTEQVSIDLSELVAEMKPLLASALKKNVDLRVETPNTAIAVMADQIQLRQVVMNLITNAADATAAKGGEVLVEAGTRELPTAFYQSEHVFGSPQPSGALAFVRVSDQGTGMSSEVITKIFDPFYSTKAKGRGLGLAAVLGILDRHGGSVRVQSEMGLGTQIEVVLPLSAQPVKVKPTQLRVTPTNGEGTILVVDDEPIIRKMARHALEPMGYAVLEAGSGEAALALLRQDGTSVSAIVLDQTMPGMGGDRTLAEVHALFPEMPVVRTSGYSAELEMQTTSKARIRILGKPFGIRQLIEAVDDVINGSEA